MIAASPGENSHANAVLTVRAEGTRASAGRTSSDYVIAAYVLESIYPLCLSFAPAIQAESPDLEDIHLCDCDWDQSHTSPHTLKALETRTYTYSVAPCARQNYACLRWRTAQVLNMLRATVLNKVSMPFCLRAASMIHTVLHWQQTVM